MIELVCDKNRAFFRETEKLTSGSIGVTINFVFSPEWDGLLKTAVFDAGEAKIDVVLTSESCEVPPEVLACPGKQLSVGVFGELADKTLVIPTIYAEAGIIRPGASPSGMSSAPPTPSWPEQVQAIAIEAKEAADSVRSDAEAGKFNGSAGEAGGWYTPAVTQPDANTMRVAFTPSKEDMPDVEPMDITLPSGGGGGGSGEDGGYYTPAVTQTAENTMQVEFTPSKATMPAVSGKAITLPAGPAGSKGEKGDKGDKGEKGADGKSAYAYAVEGGYTGTEAEFAAKLAAEKLANPNALTFTGAVTGSYDGSAPLEVAIPSGGADCTIAVDMLASGTVAQGSEDPVDTGITLGKLKEYKMFILSVSGVSNVNLHNWYTKIGDLSISRVNNVRGQTILYEFLNTEKTVMIARNGTNGNHSVYESYKASSTSYGVNNASYFPDGIYELSSISESTHVITYPIKSDTVDVKWTILGVVK